MLFSLLGYFLAFYAIYYIFIYPYFFSPYHHLPCARQPFLLRRLLFDPTSFDLVAFAKTPNNGLVRYFGFLNQERLLLTTPDICREILFRESYKFDKLPSITALQAPVGVSGLVTAKGEFHKWQRRDTIAAYNVVRSQAQYPAIWKTAKEAADTLSRRLAKAATNSILVNKFFLEVCADAVGRAAFSVDFNALPHPEQDMVKNYLVIFSAAENTPLYIKLMQLLPAPWHPAGVKIVAGLLGLDCSLIRKEVENSLTRKIQKLGEEKTGTIDDEKVDEDRIDMLGGLVRRAPNMSERYLLQHAMTILAGSVEMVSNQLSWGIYALAHPKFQHVQDKLRNEIMGNFPQLPDTFTYSDMKKVPYIMDTVNEIIRFYPSVADRGRWCNANTVLLDQTIKKGTFLTWPVWSLNRSTEFWGEDADEFRPERWAASEIDKGETSDSKREAYSFMTFGQGTRKCPGEHYTRIVMGCVLMTLMTRFRFKLPESMLDLFEREGPDAIEIGILMKAKIYADVLPI